MAEHLHHLLPGHRLLDVAVQRTDRRLLGPVIFPASAPHGLHRFQHHRDHHNRDQGQPHVGVDHKDKGSHNVYGSGNQLNHRVVQHFTHRIHVIGKAAHHIPVIVGVIIAHRQLLHLLKQIIPQLLDGILGHADHDPLLQILGNHRHQINTDHGDNPLQQRGNASALGGQSVDDGTQHIGARQIRNGSRYDAHHHDSKQQLVMGNIGKKPSQSFFHILGLSSPGPPRPARAVAPRSRAPGTSHGTVRALDLLLVGGIQPALVLLL